MLRRVVAVNVLIGLFGVNTIAETDETIIINQDRGDLAVRMG